jgi:hypothetical protein
MSNALTALDHNAIQVSAAIKVATRKETVQGVEHIVFSYRERAEAAQGRGEMIEAYRRRLAPFVVRHKCIPERLQREAAPHASRLAATMSTAVVRLQRHQSHGALDSSKLARLAAPGLSQREFDGMASRAYRRRDTQTQQQRPKIGIAGDFAFNLRMSNSEYVPMLQRLILIITEACTISNLQCAAYGTRGYLAADPVKSATAVIKDFDDELNGATYGLLATEEPFSLAFCSCTAGHGSMNGNGGVDFARAQGANFVIAIGTFPSDGARADCVVPPSATVQQAVDIISAALEARD